MGRTLARTTCGNKTNQAFDKPKFRRQPWQRLSQLGVQPTVHDGREIPSRERVPGWPAARAADRESALSDPVSPECPGTDAQMMWDSMVGKSPSLTAPAADREHVRRAGVPAARPTRDIGDGPDQPVAVSGCALLVRTVSAIAEQRATLRRAA